MNANRPRPDLEKALRQSRRAIPHQTVFAITSVTAIWALQRWLHFPTWIAWLIGFFGVFGFVGDVFNVVYCSWARRRSAGNDGA